ncbi:antitoxin [Rickettsia bellii]|uniref:Antitoxin n=2 Tax=Rickettsia bellii TaxID=33990 RepID=Q1RJA1_RICBR|nr:type II toxin-antitoxin system prevent-host-death family antitoxin [Rickettsia bellii]HJD66424.1 type II toxin-antitoxin system prevent-host-death family antitoxin [Rickettsia endosymbiont of Bembidion nr. Transversale]ABE04563.1 Antitoxin of toxin-antitoxin (TA) system Phd [Rickettsia bellii RML369-C]ABV78929.1 Antitoxin of toxin-antitoxin (TA) system Phd [Rickettsia bellii OSU 85-389]ARD86912.1 antitoxin [Rickettsia bellii]KJV89339.1 prevent-host-death family protein [Rickettsia bellii st
MEQLNATEAKREFGELLIKAQIEPISIIKNGKPVAVIISNNEFKELEAFKEQFLKIAIAEGINDISQGKIHSHKSVFDSLKMKINE